MSGILIEIGAGELADRMSIALVKSDRMQKYGKYSFSRKALEEYKVLARSSEKHEVKIDGFHLAKLYDINGRIFDLIDKQNEILHGFWNETEESSTKWGKIAEDVVNLNNERCELKRKIDIECNTKFSEIKSELDLK